MKIQEFTIDKQADETRKRELLKLLSQPSEMERRPCQSCVKICACDKHSNRCTCECSVKCADAPRYLSSDPVRFPLEENVVPLAYAMSVLRLVPPCWSCEGHLTKTGDLVRLPQLWFYSASTLYPELISEYLHMLGHLKETSCQWLVSVCPHTASNATTFTIKPEHSVNDKLANDGLRQLQDDLHMISRSLRDDIFKIARGKLAEIDRCIKDQNIL